MKLKSLWQKEKIAHFEQFILLLQCFQKSSTERRQKVSVFGKWFSLTFFLDTNNFCTHVQAESTLYTFLASWLSNLDSPATCI